jgi:hypothetical protein
MTPLLAPLPPDSVANVPRDGRYRPIRLRKAAGAVHPTVERLALCRIDFRFLNSPEHVGIASRTLLKAPINAATAVIGHLTFGLRSSCERAEAMLALVTRVTPVSTLADTFSPFEAASAVLTLS